MKVQPALQKVLQRGFVVIAIELNLSSHRLFFQDLQARAWQLGPNEGQVKVFAQTVADPKSQG